MAESKPQLLMIISVYTDNHRPGMVFAEVEDIHEDAIGRFWTKPCNDWREAIDVAKSEYEIRKIHRERERFAGSARHSPLNS